MVGERGLKLSGGEKQRVNVECFDERSCSYPLLPIRTLWYQPFLRLKI